MKPQDIVFLLIVGFLVFKRSPRLAVLAGIACLLLSMPLFSLWIFFTAQRLVMYAATFFLLAILLTVRGEKKKKV